MTLGPIAFGRIPDQLSFKRMLGTLAEQQREMLRVQDQLATGIRIRVPSDEPGTSLQAISLQKILEQKSQIKKNLSSAEFFLAATDSTLFNLGESLREAQALALVSIGDSSTASEKQAALNQINGIIDQLVVSANQQIRGRYLFGGGQINRAPYVKESGLVRYTGDTGSVLTFSDLDSLLATNISGNRVFGGISTAVAGIVDLDPVLRSTTRLDHLNAGSGVTRGEIEISDGSTTTNIDLTHAETVGDVIALIQDQGPAGITVAINGAGDGLEITLASGTLTVREAGLGKTASDLGILAQTPVGLTLTGGDLDPQLTLTTELSDLLGGSGFDQASGLTITNGGQTQTLDFASDVTVEDLLNRLNGAGLGLRAEINAGGSGIEISTLLSGSSFTIGENGGTTATDLGVRSFHLQTRLADLNFGAGVAIAVGDDLTITRKDGVVLNIGLDTAGTVSDVINLINTHPDNTGGNLTAQLTSQGNGIELVDTTGGTGSLSASGRSASGLGIQTTVPDPGTTLTGTDVNPQEVASVFTALIRLRDGLLIDDNSEIERAAAALSTEIEKLALAQGEIGSRLQAVENRRFQLSGEELQLRETLSELIDTDLAQAITDLQLRQSAFEAALVASSFSLRSNLLDFL